MARKYLNAEIPKAGSKILYMVSAKQINCATVLRKQDLEKYNYNTLPDAPCYLTDYTSWDMVKIWWYQDENYNYGKEQDGK